MTGGGPGRLLALLALLALACNRAPPAKEEKVETLLELRDAQGQPTFTLQRLGDGGFRYLEVGGRPVRVLEAPDGFRAGDPGRGVVRAQRLDGGGLAIFDSDKLMVKLTRDGPSWRLGDAAGVPLYRVRLDDKLGEGVGHDAGGMVIVRVKASGGRLVVSDRDGSTRALITGKLDQVSLVRATLASLPSLGAAERALLLIAAGD
jgi:hypothetical protein